MTLYVVVLYPTMVRASGYLMFGSAKLWFRVTRHTGLLPYFLGLLLVGHGDGRVDLVVQVFLPPVSTRCSQRCRGVWGVGVRASNLEACVPCAEGGKGDNQSETEVCWV